MLHSSVCSNATRQEICAVQQRLVWTACSPTTPCDVWCADNHRQSDKEHNSVAPFCVANGQLKLAWVLLIWYEHILALQAVVEEEEYFGVEGPRADAVVVPFKQAQLLVSSILGQQPL